MEKWKGSTELIINAKSITNNPPEPYSIVNIVVKFTTTIQKLIMFCILCCDNKFTTFSQRINLWRARGVYWIETLLPFYAFRKRGLIGNFRKNPNGNHKITFIFRTGYKKTDTRKYTLSGCPNENGNGAIPLQIVPFARHDKMMFQHQNMHLPKMFKLKLFGNDD